MYWTVGIEGGPKRVNHAAATIGDKIFSFGGYCNDLEYLEIDDIDVYVLDTGKNTVFIGPWGFLLSLYFLKINVLICVLHFFY